MHSIEFSKEAKEQFVILKNQKHKKTQFKAVSKVLGFMQLNLRHPSLKTHKYDGMKSKYGEVFESYAQNNTPGAYRIFWTYGPNRGVITIVSITPHP